MVTIVGECCRAHTLDPLLKGTEKAVRQQMFPFHCHDNGTLVFTITEGQAFSLDNKKCIHCQESSRECTLSDDVLLQYQCTNQSCSCLKSSQKSFTWYLCTACLYCGSGGRLNSGRKHIRDKHMVSMKHRESLQRLQNTYQQQQECAVRESQQEKNNIPSRKRSTDYSDKLKDSLDDLFDDDQLVTILWYELGKKKSGMEPLIMSSCFPREFNKHTDSALTEDLMGELRSGYLFFQMTRDMRERVMKQCLHYYSLGRRHEREDAQRVSAGSAVLDTRKEQANLISETTTRLRRILPTGSVNDLNHRYLIGSSSLTENLPIPVVVKTKGDHAVTDPVDCIRDFLAHGCIFQEISPELLEVAPDTGYCWITETPRAREILSFLQTSD